MYYKNGELKKDPTVIQSFNENNTVIILIMQWKLLILGLEIFY